MTVISTLDWVIILGYFTIILGIAWWVIKQKNNTSEEYFLGGRNLGWFVVGASIFASNIGSEHIVGLAGSGATDGVALAQLRVTCLVFVGTRLGIGSLLYAFQGIYDAGILRTAPFRLRPVGYCL